MILGLWAQPKSKHLGDFEVPPLSSLRRMVCAHWPVSLRPSLAFQRIETEKRVRGSKDR